jgi:GAF domain-containing protein
MALRDGDVIRVKAQVGMSKEFDEFLKANPIGRDRGKITGRAFLTGEVVHLPDILSDPEYTFVESPRVGRWRAALAVPLIREGRVEGVFGLTRPSPGPFSDREIALVRTFADQALIAIENVRLFNETKEALERQTATADILKVIASSPSDVQPVFDAIAMRSNRLIGGSSTAVFSVVDDKLHLMSFTTVSSAADAALKAVTDVPLSAFPVADAIRNHEVSQIVDTEVEGMPVFLRDVARLRGWRSALTVPMVRESKLVGTIAVTRAEPGLFDDHHVQLLQTFADQAVIAIENVRLFDEVKARTEDLRQSLEYQTATSEVLSIISRSPTDVQPVFEAIAASALRLCGAKWSVVTRFDGAQLHLAALHNLSDPEGVDAIRKIFPDPSAGEARRIARS